FTALRQAAQESTDPEVRGRADRLARTVVLGLERRTLDGHEGQVNRIVLSHDGRHVLSGGLDTTMRLWDVATGKEVRRFEGHTGGVWGVALSSDGKRALSGGGSLVRNGNWVEPDSSVRLWDVQTGQELRRFEGHKRQVLTVAFAPDGRRAVSGG